jgi:hypothetical protein
LVALHRTVLFPGTRIQPEYFNERKWGGIMHIDVLWHSWHVDDLPDSQLLVQKCTVDVCFTPVPRRTRWTQFVRQKLTLLRESMKKEATARLATTRAKISACAQYSDRGPFLVAVVSHHAAFVCIVLSLLACYPTQTPYDSNPRKVCSDCATGLVQPVLK